MKLKVTTSLSLSSLLFVIFVQGLDCRSPAGSRRSRRPAENINMYGGIDLRSEEFVGRWLGNVSELQLRAEWSAWKGLHRKRYSTSLQDLERYVVWRSNKAYINYHNSFASTFGFYLAMNQFGDLTSDEYDSNVRCVETNFPYYNPSNSTINTTYFDPSSYSSDCIPSYKDWRDEGVVTPVKDQGRCKSCYAFAVTGALESMKAIDEDGTKLLSLSEQNIIDCSVPYGNRGCGGGSRESSIMYAIDFGIDTSSSYPYIARQNLCLYSTENVGVLSTGMMQIKSGAEDHLKVAVALAGPVTVSIDSRHSAFQFYSSGIYNQPYCSPKKLTHTLLAVGYGTQDGKDYWLLKNSWGTTWGTNGYVLMTRNYYNQCGIASKALFPTVA